MPGIAQHIAFKYYDEKCCPVYSFSQKFSELNADIRSQLFGGMTVVLGRAINLNPNPDSRYPASTYQAANGDRFIRMLFVDFNSLYVESLNY